MITDEKTQEKRRKAIKESRMKNQNEIEKENKLNWYWYVKLFNIILITTFMGYGLFRINEIGGLILSIVVGIWLYISLNE